MSKNNSDGGKDSHPSFDFLDVQEIGAPKEIRSLVSLWEEMFPHQANASSAMQKKYRLLLEQARVSIQDEQSGTLLDNIILDSDNVELFNIVRAFHVKIHLQEIDNDVLQIEAPRMQLKKEEGGELLNSHLILQSYLDYLKANGTEKFGQFVNQSILRLISTVHPNETERNTNLMHYTSIQEKYIAWKKDFESLQSLKRNAPEYRIRREGLNQLRREIKAEMEGLWQSDQMRKDSINVQNEAKRILERYKVIFKAYPTFLKFIKHLANEAFWRYQASRYSSSVDWMNTFQAIYREVGTSREDKLKAIKRTFQALSLNFTLPRIVTPVISFSTWKGGDRDGNPFVIASFSNQTFVEQKDFVLQQYVDMARQLLDKLTLSTNYVGITEELKRSLVKDHKLFPYITNIKPQEPYRAKTRYILEKLENSLSRVREVKKQSGETVKPLLGLTLPGPTGYNSTTELQADMNLLYDAMIKNEGKAQARSLLQDFYILVDTFGLHMTAIDFRQTSEKNTTAIAEYLTAIGHPDAGAFKKMPESEKQKVLVELIAGDEQEISPWVLNSLSKISRDTFETLMIFADAARADPRSVGKFIISMCQNASDMLNVLLLMKLNGMLETSNGVITSCPFDVTGLFETIEDLKAAPRIIRDFLSIRMVKDYIIKHRYQKLTVMLGYSDSVRDGSSFTSDAQVAKTTVILRELQEEINQGLPETSKVQFVFYRGRGDTLPRGFGGSISKALMSQLVTTPEEDHTEQNRYLRRYATVSSALDHLHIVYSAHLSSLLRAPHPKTKIFLDYFDFFGMLSNLKWNSLVKVEDGGRGLEYFKILNNYSILAHLPRSNFASRPVARDGVTWDIENIRAIPFTMALAQMREFTNTYYGLGTALEIGSQILENTKNETSLGLLNLYLSTFADPKDGEEFLKTLSPNMPAVSPTSSQPSNLINVLKETLGEQLGKLPEVKSALESVVQNPNYQHLKKTIKLYSSVKDGISAVAGLLLDLKRRNTNPLAILQEMYRTFAPFRYSIENKETALIIRNKRVVEEYTKGLDSQLKPILEETEAEGELTTQWILKINGQTQLVSKTMTQDFNSPELFLLHKIQSKWMQEYRTTQNQIRLNPGNKDLQQKLQKLNICVQMTILAVSEALGFGG